MRHELWDFEGGNLVGAYSTRDEALDAVRQTIRLYGREAAVSLLLGREGISRRSTLVAKGPALADLAIGTAVAAPVEQTRGRTPSIASGPAPSGRPAAAASGAYRPITAPRSVRHTG